MTMPDKFIDLDGVPVLHGLVTEEVNNHHDATKQDALVSGTNIKTINGDSILGAGDLVVQGGESFPQLTLTPTGETEEGMPTGTLSDEDYATISALPSGIKLPSLTSETDYTLYTCAAAGRNDQSELTTIKYYSLLSGVQGESETGGLIVFNVDCATKTWAFQGIVLGNYNDVQTALQQIIGVYVTLETDYQKKLVSGTNIKSINNDTVLGEGNLKLVPCISITTNATSGTLELADRAILNRINANAAIEIVEEVESGTQPIIEVYYVYKRNPRSIFAINMDSQSPKIFGVNRNTGEWSINTTSFGVSEARVQEMINGSVTSVIEEGY